MENDWLPSLGEARALVTVLEMRNFTAAARQLRLSPARVSELIKGLESRVGVRLVERTTRAVAPTIAGELLAARFRQTLENYREAIDSLNALRDSPVGQLRLTVAPPAADLVLAPIMGRFLERHPGVELEVAIDRSFVDIVEKRFDAGIRPGQMVDKDMISVRISNPMPFAVAASPAYLARKGTPVRPEDLASHPCIRFRMPNNVVASFRFIVAGRLLELDGGGPLVANEPSLAVRAAVDGIGMIQLPRPYLAQAIASGELVEVLGDCEQPKVDAFHIYYPSRRQMRAPLKAFVRFLQEESRRTESGAQAISG